MEMMNRVMKISILRGFVRRLSVFTFGLLTLTALWSSATVLGLRHNPLHGSGGATAFYIDNLILIQVDDDTTVAFADSGEFFGAPLPRVNSWKLRTLKS